ncbi:MAG: sigma 54-interacting transcriptional regulator, partial [Myxococcaceae bacterium]
ELFGYTKGAFTGAVAARKGLFEAAHGGTLFLDEIGDISPAMQVRLLRVLQEGEVRRVGSNETVKVDVRIIAATHVDLDKARNEARFREDLFYRLNVITVTLPALRERPEDVPALAHHFVEVYAKKLARPVPRISAEALELLVTNSWRGNVRELENVIERAVLLARSPEITPAELPPGFTQRPSATAVPASSLSNLTYSPAKKLAIRAFDRLYVTTQLQRAGGNITAAARTAGLDRSNFRRLLRQSELTPQDGAEPDDPASDPEADAPESSEPASPDAPRLVVAGPGV